MRDPRHPNMENPIMLDRKERVYTDKVKHVGNLLKNNKKQADETGEWSWLSNLAGRKADKKSANKFMLGAIIDYQINADRAWENAKRFAETVRGDPPDLWNDIVSIEDWKTDDVKRRYNLHWQTDAHIRVQRIGREIVDTYGGDAREIWDNQSPSEILERLCNMRVGEWISRMIVGALYDTGQISEAGDLKADIHVKKVLGRVFTGESVSPKEALAIANDIAIANDTPGQSWMIDSPLYWLGKKICTKTDPKCTGCYLCDQCVYAANAKAK